jgi:hypothetical protein
MINIIHIIRLADIGYSVGLRLLEYSAWREKLAKRDTNLVRFLQFISNNVWKTLFGKAATLEKSVEKKDQCKLNYFFIPTHTNIV